MRVATVLAARPTAWPISSVVASRASFCNWWEVPLSTRSRSSEPIDTAAIREIPGNGPPLIRPGAPTDLLSFGPLVQP